MVGQKKNSNYKQNSITTVFLRLLFQLILAPEQGWRDIADADRPVRSLLLGGFYPLLLLTSLTVLLGGLYHPGQHSWTVLLQLMAVEFVKFFITYHIAVYVFDAYGHRFTDYPVSTQRNQTFILFGLSLLALMDLVYNCLPIPLTIIWFFAIYVAYILLRGCSYMHIPERNTQKFMILTVVVVIALTFVLGFLFNKMIS